MPDNDDERAAAFQPPRGPAGTRPFEEWPATATTPA